MKKVLVYYRYFGRTLGGGEYLPLAFAAELQKKCAVTLALDWTDNVELAAEKLGVSLDFSRLAIVQAMPPGFHGTTNGPLLSYRRFCRLRRLAADADICISMANLMDFGKPAHHFLITIGLGDPAFDDFAAGRSASLPVRAKRMAGSALRPLLGMRSKRALLADPRQRLYPNSGYAARLIENFYGPFSGHVFYPPTLFEFSSAGKPVRNPFRIVYLGRVSPAKRILDLVAIVDKARALSGAPLELRLAGRLDESPFKTRLLRLASTRPWLALDGEVYGREKEDFLRSATYAIHAMRTEAFGISVTEYLKAGLLPVVPDEGGSCEVVDNPALTYRSDDEAAALLSRLVADPSFRDAQLQRCAKRARLFSRDAYLARQSSLLRAILA